LRKQDKREELRSIEMLLSRQGEDFRTSRWGQKKVRRAVNFLFKFVDLPRSEQILCLDLGIGTGTFTSYFQERFSVVGLDLSRSILRITKKRIPNVPLIAADGEIMPFPNSSFDIIFASQFLHHSFPCLDTILEEIKRILKKGGYFLSVEANGWNPVVIYWHKAPWKVRERCVTSNQTLFGYLKFKRQLKKHGFTVLGAKTTNFGIDFCENFLSNLPLIKFLGGSMVVCSISNRNMSIRS